MSPEDLIQIEKEIESEMMLTQKVWVGIIDDDGLESLIKVTPELTDIVEVLSLRARFNSHRNAYVFGFPGEIDYLNETLEEFSKEVSPYQNMTSKERATWLTHLIGFNCSLISNYTSYVSCFT